MRLLEGLVTSSGAALVVEPCISALAAGDGRELWSLRPSGQLFNEVGKKCAGLAKGSGSAVARVVLEDCAANLGGDSGRWEALPNGQLRYGSPGTHCLSQRGVGPGETNVALGAAVAASSTLEAQAHGASLVVDGRDTTYWASEFGITEPVVLTIDLGTSAHLLSIEILWEFPAKEFSVALSEDGTRWSDIFSTDTNMVKATRVRLGSRPATLVRLTMRAPHPVYGQAHGRALYGIRSLNLFSLGMISVVDSCVDAAWSGDARGKYFAVHVCGFDLSSAEAP